jgi:hypothetical protein
MAEELHNETLSSTGWRRGIKGGLRKRRNF